MAIADRISAMYDHIGDIYDTLELGGDTTQNKNIVNINTEIKREYKDFLAHGTDELWNNWEKVSGSGESLSLSPTIKGKMKVDLKGNTSQETTTGKNKYNATRSSSTTNAVTYSGDTSKIYINGTPNNTGRIFFNKTYLEAGTYTFSGTLSKGSFTNGGNNQTYLYLYKGTESQASWDFDVRILLTATTGNVASATFTISEGSYYYLAWYLDTSYTWTNAEIKYQVESGSSFTSFEPYTGENPAPSPDYPYQVNVVSGDNEINICGKNLFDKDEVQIGKAWNNTNNSARAVIIILVEQNVPYTISMNGNNSMEGIYVSYSAKTLEENYINGVGLSQITTFPRTYTSSTEYIILQFNKSSISLSDVENLKLQVEKGSTATTYEPYQGNTYNIDLPVENLFDDSTTTNILIADNGEEQPNTNIKTSTYIKVNPNSKYTYSCEILQGQSAGWEKFSYYDVNKSYLSYLYTTDKNKTITLPTNCEYVRIGYHINFVTNVQLEKGTKYNSFTPYGTTPIELCKIGEYQDSIVKDNGKWYLNKQIGKVAFSDLVYNEIGGNFSQFSTNGNIAMVYLQNDLKVTGNRDDVFCNLLKPYSSSLFGGLQTGINQYYNATKLLLSVPLANVEEFAGETLTVNNYLSYTQNYIKGLEGYIYYIVATPTYTEITDTTLLSQLEALAYSYDEQTNISQVNDDMPFVLDITALKEMS